MKRHDARTPREYGCPDSGTMKSPKFSLVRCLFALSVWRPGVLAFSYLSGIAASVLLLAAACSRRPAAPPPDAAPPPPLVDRIDRAVERGAEFLLSRQGEDGAVRSPTYAYFKDGYSLTPLALAAVFALPERPAGYARGVDFLTTMLGTDRKLRVDAEGPRYPLYSIAIGALVLNAKGNERHAALRDAMLAELRARQLADENGWTPEDLSYGGWGYYDGIPRRPEDFDVDPTEEVASNLSATTFAIGALALARQAPAEPALARARVFVERCQGPDGGFFFSPAIADGNKAGPLPPDGGVPSFRSYGSMTADGVRSLLRLGAPPSDARVAAARGWLEQRFDAERNPGDFAPVNEQRRGSSYFYWAWSAAHALRALGVTMVRGTNGDVRWAEALAQALLARQRPDGSWANEYSEMREDDPVVATAFATAALGVCRLALSAQYRSHSSW
jgi:hypothetical protein